MPGVFLGLKFQACVFFGVCNMKLRRTHPPPPPPPPPIMYSSSIPPGMNNYINFGEQNFHPWFFVSPQNENSEVAGRNRSVRGQDQKFPPAPGANQIAGFREFRLLTRQEKK